MKKTFTQLILTLLIFPLSVFATDFSIVLEGQGRYVLTNPLGEQIGSQGTVVHEQIASSSLQLTNQGQSTYIVDAAKGTYELAMTGHTYDRNARLTITASTTRYQYDIVTKTDHSNTYELTLSQTAAISSSFTPIQLSHTDTDNTVILTWNPPLEGISHYTIYRKAWDFPFYEQLATTNQTTYQTNDSWGTVLDERNTIPTDWYSYRVTWTDANGNESVLSNTVSNSDRDGDGLNDWRETNTTGTNPDNSDTDSDNLNDFLEINLYRTDPNDPDTDDDTYSDGLEIQQGTNPLDSTSTPEASTQLDDGRDTTLESLNDGRDPGATPGTPVYEEEPFTGDDQDYGETDDPNAPVITPEPEENPTYDNGRDPGATPGDPVVPEEPPTVDESGDNDSDDPNAPPVDPVDDPSQPVLNSGRDPNDVPGEPDTPEDPNTPDETGDNDQDTVDSNWNGRSSLPTTILATENSGQHTLQRLINTVSWWG